MLDIIIRGLAILLLVGAGLHGWGSLLAFKPKTPERAWSLGSAGFAAFLALSAWLAVDQHDSAASWLVIFGCLAWLLTVGAFGRAIGNIADPRVLYHLVVSAALAATLMANII